MLKVSIISSFAAAAIYCMFLAAQNHSLYTYIMLLICEFHVVWVVYSIFKDKKTPDKTFDEYLYEDSNRKWSS